MITHSQANLVLGLGWVLLCAAKHGCSRNSELGRNGNHEYSILTVINYVNCSKPLRKLHKTAENYRQSLGVTV